MNALIIVALVVTLGGPLLLGLAGAFRKAPAATQTKPRWNWRFSFVSAMLYALAFNVIFFIQELFLVVPKALTPGLRPTLFHNNHAWDGDNPLAHLFPGAGALAILLTALAFAAWLRLSPPRNGAVRMLAIWMAFSGFFQSLPQVVVGAVFPGNDVGMAMTYLELPPLAKTVAALAALVAIAAAAIFLARCMLSLATPAEAETPARRTAFMFRIATLPAIFATLAIFAFRVPGSIDQVYIVPIAVAVIGISWMQASAWAITPRGESVSPSAHWALPLAALAIVFATFHIVLRPGVPFY